MSIDEIKLQIDRLTVAEQLQIESFLKAKRVGEMPEFRERIAAAHRRMDGGTMVSSGELRALLSRQHPAAS